MHTYAKSMFPLTLQKLIFFAGNCQSVTRYFDFSYHFFRMISFGKISKQKLPVSKFLLCGPKFFLQGQSCWWRQKKTFDLL